MQLYNLHDLGHGINRKEYGVKDVSCCLERLCGSPDATVVTAAAGLPSSLTMPVMWACTLINELKVGVHDVTS